MPVPQSSQSADFPEPTPHNTQSANKALHRSTPEHVIPPHDELSIPLREVTPSVKSVLSILPNTSGESQLAFCEITQRVKGTPLYDKLLDAKTTTTDFVDVITNPRTLLENKLIAGFVLRELKSVAESILTQFETERCIFYTLRSESNPQVKHALSLALQNPLPEIANELAQLLDHPRDGDYASVALRGSVGEESMKPLRALLRTPSGSYEQTRAISTLFLSSQETIKEVFGGVPSKKYHEYPQYYLACLENTVKQMSPKAAHLAEQIVMSTPCDPSVYESFEKTSPISFGFLEDPEFIYAQQHPAPEEFPEPVKVRVFLRGKNMRSMENRSNVSLTLTKYSLLLLAAQDKASSNTE
ncbi:MAG: hypothetical protein ACO3XO_09285 [Bdellovibrionota bacterium]